MIWALIGWFHISVYQSVENVTKCPSIGMWPSVKIIRFSKRDQHASPLFKELNILKCHVIFIHDALFMYQFHNKMLPPAFTSYFQPVSSIDKYNTLPD